MDTPIHPLLRKLSRRAVAAAASIALSLPLVVASSAAHAWWGKKDKPPQVVQNLNYGAVLYSFYQEDYFQALVELSIATKKGGIEGHGSRPELLVGGLSLSYGMDKKAEAIFEKLLDESVDPQVRDQAWFYLGKMYYQRKEQDRALQTLNKIQGDLPRALRDEYHFLKAVLLGNKQELDAAEKLVDKIATVPWYNYGNYNLAMAYVAKGDFQTAQSYLDIARGVDEFYLNSERAALLDRIYLAKGYLYLQDKQPELASEAFKQIRLSSPWSDHALLGYGWAAFESKDYAMAVQAWRRLQNQPVIGPIMHEAFVAEPQIFEILNDQTGALRSFQRAERRYVAEIRNLEGFIQQIAEFDLSNYWPCDLEQTWSSQINELEAGSETPQHPYLIHLAAQHNFQTTKQDWCDVSKLQRNLERWQQSADGFKYMLETRYIAREQQIERIAQWKSRDPLPSLVVKRNALAGIIARADRDQNGLLLLNEEQLELRSILDSAKASYEKIKATDPDAEEYAEKLRRIEGVLKWQAAEQLSRQLREANKLLLELDEEIAKNKQSSQRLDTLVAEPVEITALQARVEVMQQRIEEKLADVRVVREAAQTRLRNLVIDELRREQSNIRGYLSQARLAIARIYDELYQAGSGK